MNKLPLSTAVLSVIAAVLLWYVATRLEERVMTPATAIPDSSLPAFGRQVEESDILGGAAALRCRRAEESMQQLVDDARYCRQDSDCTIFDYGYPIQCLTSVASNEITHLRLEYRKYEASCEFRVYYDCPSEPLERHPVCRNNRCEVELRTLDYLRDETLQHLGIGDVAETGPGPANRENP